MAIFKKAAKRKEARQTARIERKQTRVEGKQEAKQSRIKKRSDAVQSRVAKRSDAVQSRVAKRSDSSMMNGNENTERSRLAEVDAAQENTGNEEITLQQQIKGANYLKRRNRTPETTPDMIAAQVAEERQREIEQRNAGQIAEIKAANEGKNQNWGLEEGETMEEEINEDLELPDMDDTHEDILEEEEMTFGFDGNEDNYLDPDTLGILLKGGQAAADKYRQKRFKEGKKYFGKTQKQWEAEEARKLKVSEGDRASETAIEAALREAEQEAIKAAKKSYTNEMWAAGILLVLVGFYLYSAGKKSS